MEQGPLSPSCHDASVKSALTRCQLNRLRSPLLRLPPELYPTILHPVIEGYYRRRPDYWLRLGHICHDLRVALLDMHALWADVVFNHRSERAHEEFLKRARKHPISIHLDSDTSSAFVDRALPLLSGARIIDVRIETTPRNGPVETIVTALSKSLRQESFSALEELHLEIPYHRDPLVDMSLGEPNVTTTTPQLRVFEATNVFIPLNMSMLSELSLTWTSSVPLRARSNNLKPLPDARAFLDMLSHYVNLEKLVLRSWIPDRAALRNLSYQQGLTISFPRLSHLKLKQDMQSILEFWSILDIPVTAALDVNACEIHYSYDPEILLLLADTRSLRAFVSQTQITGISKITKLHIYYTGDPGLIAIKLGSDDASLAVPSPALSRHEPTSRLHYWDTDSFDLRFVVNTAIDWETSQDMIAFIQCLCTTLEICPENITTLSLDGGNGCFKIDEGNFHTMFPSITTLQFVYLHTDIGPILSSSDVSLGGPRFYPDLQAVYMERTFSPKDLEQLTDAIEKRVIEHGGLLRSVTLRGTFPESEMEVEARCLKRLEGLVPFVYFDASFRC
ncbi:hypothetical protein PENSPDRAFT_759225, partial [Peniophora sp. CONT]